MISFYDSIDPFTLTLNERIERDTWQPITKCVECGGPLPNAELQVHGDCESFRLSHYKNMADQTQPCIADLNSPCDCPKCAESRRESMAYALASYEPAQDDECECGGTYDEHDRCSDCSNGHQDCEANECFSCLERSIDRAESMAEGMER